MTTKEYLKSASRMSKIIENKSEEIGRLIDLATRITSQTDGERVQESGSYDKMADAVAGICDLKKELKTIVDDCIEKRKTITKQIEGLDDDMLYDVLYKRYILCKPFRVIAVELNYDMGYLFRVHKKALNAFEKRYGSVYM